MKGEEEKKRKRERERGWRQKVRSTVKATGADV